MKHIKNFNESVDKDGAEKWMDDFMKDSGLTKEEALLKLKELAKELKKIKQRQKPFHESSNDITMVEKYGNLIIAFQKDIDNNKLSLMNGYFSGTAFIGSENSRDGGSVDFSSPFHTGSVMHDVDDEEDLEEVDFRFHESLSKSIIRKYLDKYVSDNYTGKIVKIYYH